MINILLSIAGSVVGVLFLIKSPSCSPSLYPVIGLLFLIHGKQYNISKTLEELRSNGKPS